MEEVQAWRCAAIALLFTTSLTAGCTSNSASQLTGSGSPACTSLDCLREASARPLYEACMDDLFLYTASHRKRQAIDAEYGYPLRNAESYRNWVRLGGRAPAPHEWCEYYAAAKAANPHGWRAR